MLAKTSSADFVTKSYLDSRLKIFKGELLEEIDENAKKYRDEILTRLDPVIAEIENARLDRELGASQTSAIREAVEDHEKRIAHLEEAA